jgi:hypothetical protein
MKAKNLIVRNNYPADWQQYDGMAATLNTPFLDYIEMDSTMREIWMKLYHKETIRRKMFRTLWNTRSFSTAYFTYATSHNYGRMFLERYISAGDEINEKLEWINKKRSLYLRNTDLIIWLLYRVSWQKMLKRFR